MAVYYFNFLSGQASWNSRSYGHMFIVRALWLFIILIFCHGKLNGIAGLTGTCS